MKIKKSLSLLLAIIMLVALFSACATPASDSGKEETPPPKDNDVEDKTDVDSTDEPEDSEDQEELVTIEFWWSDNDTGNIGSDGLARVSDEINKITEAEIGVHVNFSGIAKPDYTSHMGLAIMNNEQVDLALYMPGVMAFTTQFANGYMMDITEYVDEYGQGIKDLLGPVLAGGEVGGKLYGICTYRVLNSDGYWCAEKAVLSEAGVLEQAEKIQSWSDMESVFQAIVDKTDEAAIGGNRYIFDMNVMYLFPDGDNIFKDAICYDALGDNLDMIVPDQEGHITPYWEHPAVVDQMKRAKRWLDAGYIYDESAYTTDSAEILLSQGMYASYIVNSEIGVAVNKQQQIGKDLLCLCLTDYKGMVGQGVACRRGAYVPITSKEPEAAVKFLNMLYTDERLMNLLIWGVEDTHYVVNEEGEACYPEGTDTMSCGYHNFDFMIANQFLCLPWEGLGRDFRAEALDNFNNAPRSVFLGLSVDIGDLSSEVAAIKAVTDEYSGMLRCGQYTEQMYQEFLTKLAAAGEMDYIKVFQDAVDAWLA